MGSRLLFMVHRMSFSRYSFWYRHSPPVAAEATIARVKAPHSNGQEDYSMVSHVRMPVTQMHVEDEVLSPAVVK
jgi:hypothetical protein